VQARWHKETTSALTALANRELVQLAWQFVT
jgi:hypothetical protein